MRPYYNVWLITLTDGTEYYISRIEFMLSPEKDWTFVKRIRDRANDKITLQIPNISIRAIERVGVNFISMSGGCSGFLNEGYVIQRTNDLLKINNIDRTGR